MNKILSTLLLSLLAFSAAAQVTTGTRFGFRSVTDPAYSGGAQCGTETSSSGSTGSDHSAFQGAMDAAATAGGGDVYVPACSAGTYYYFRNQILIPSNVNLVCQRGAVLRTYTDSTNGAISYTKGTGLVGFYGVSNAGLYGCTLDTYAGSATTPGNQPNPLEVGTATPSGDGSNTTGTGTRSSNITIQGNEILSRAYAGSGKYMIWLRRADNVKVLSNKFDSFATTFLSNSDHQAVECYGCRNLEIAYNEMRRIGRWGIYVAALGGVADTASEATTDGVNIHDNYIDVAVTGIVLAGAHTSGGAAMPIRNAIVRANIVKNSWEAGIKLQTTSGEDDTMTVLWDNVLITNNVIENATAGAETPQCMWVYSNTAFTQGRSVLISDNTCIGGRGTADTIPTGLDLTYANNVSFVGNKFSGSSTATHAPLVRFFGAANDLLFEGNHFADSPGHVLFATSGYPLNRITVLNNRFENYGTATGQTQAIQIGASATHDEWVVSGNIFKRNTSGTEGYIMNGGSVATNTDWTWRNNVVLHTVGTGRQAETVGLWDAITCTLGASPSGANAGVVPNVNGLNFGCVRVPGGGAYNYMTVTNPQVNLNSTIVLHAISGVIPYHRVGLANGSFLLYFGANITVETDIKYEIIN